MDNSGWLYIMANDHDGALYVGVTGNLAHRLHEHKAGAVEGFGKPTEQQRLVYAEQHNYIERALQREHRLRKWPRAWKLDLIKSHNPDWRDLSDKIV